MPAERDHPQQRLGKSQRLHHRSRAHASAHADESAADTRLAIAHPLIPQGEPDVIIDPDALAELIDHLKQSSSFAYDSEFIGELSYVPKLCLIQVASATRLALIDPLAELDLTAFWNLVCDPAVEKIVHAGQQDIEPVFRHVSGTPQNLYDTQIAAGFIGLPYPMSLSKLVQVEVGVKLSKGLTFTHWDQRPLSPMQLRYAADDVRYLPAIRAEQGKKLEELGHTAWAAEECSKLATPGVYQFNPRTHYQRIRGWGNLSASGKAVLRELTIWRDQAARAEDVPPRTMLKDEVLLEMARYPVKSEDRLGRIKGLPRSVEADHGSAIVAATQRALALPPEELPADAPESEPTPEEKFQCDMLWSLAQLWCYARQMDPNLVASRSDVGDLCKLLTADQVSQSPLLRGWRAGAVGNVLVQFLRGDQQWLLQFVEGKLKGTAQGRS